jgi:hypothetical protein
MSLGLGFGTLKPVPENRLGRPLYRSGRFLAPVRFVPSLHSRPTCS